MDYAVENIEDQLIATLQANANLSGVDVRTHAGQISVQMFLDPQYVEGLIPRLPFVYLRYKGRTATMRDSVGKLWAHELQWEFYVAAQSLRQTQESQRYCYGMLRGIFDSIHGKWVNVSNLPSILTPLGGTPINLTTYPNFKSISSFLEVGGQDEKLIMQLPRISVYSTTYKVTVQTI